MFQTLIVASVVVSAVAFSPASFARPTLAKLSMSAEGKVGSTAPLGYFDPLKLSEGKTDGEVKVIIINTSIICDFSFVNLECKFRTNDLTFAIFVFPENS
jgi:hypothetical protein